MMDNTGHTYEIKYPERIKELRRNQQLVMEGKLIPSY